MTTANFSRTVWVPAGPRAWLGLAAVVFSGIYLFSDVLEVAQADFSAVRLTFTYVGEAAIPLFVLGLYAAQRPSIGRLGLFGAVAYAYAYVFFTSTVVFALVAGTRNYADLSDKFGAWMVVHGVILLAGGLAFGAAVVRAGVLPRWTGACLMVGVILVVAVSGHSNLARTIAAAFPAAAFTGMGCALMSRSTTERLRSSRSSEPALVTTANPISSDLAPARSDGAILGRRGARPDPVTTKVPTRRSSAQPL